MKETLLALLTLLSCGLSDGAKADTPETLRALVSVGCLETAEGIAKLKLRSAIRCYQKANGATPTGELSEQQEAALLEDAQSGKSLNVPIRYTLPKPAAPRVIAGVDFRAEQANALWGDVCVSDRYLGSFEGRIPIKDGTAASPLQSLTLGYRYNPLIVMPGAAAQANYDYIKNYPEQFDRALIAIARERADWVSQERLKALTGELPFFWRTELVYFAPAVGDPYSTCANGHITKIDFQYSLFLGAAGPRVYGDLCATVPTIIFGRSNYKNLRLTEVFDSALLLGWDVRINRLTSRYADDFARDKFLDTLRKIMGLHEVQCGRPMLEMDVIFEEQLAAYHVGNDQFFRPEAYMKPALRGSLMRTPEDRLVFEVEEKSSTAVSAERNAARERDVRRRLAEYRAGLGKRFALGALLVMGGAAYASATIFNDCNRAWIPGDPPRPLQCADDLK